MANDDLALALKPLLYKAGWRLHPQAIAAVLDALDEHRRADEPGDECPDTPLGRALNADNPQTRIANAALQKLGQIDPPWDKDPENPKNQCIPPGGRYKLNGHCAKCSREWIVVCQTGTEVTMKAFYCPCGHMTDMDGGLAEAHKNCRGSDEPEKQQ